MRSSIACGRRTLAHTVPMCDLLFAEPPAEQDGPSIHDARKVKQTDIEVFDLHADGIDFRDRILYAPVWTSRAPLCVAQDARYSGMCPSEEDAVGNFLQFSIDGFDQLSTIDRSAQPAIRALQIRLSLFESKGAFCHTLFSYCNSFDRVSTP